MVTDWGLDRLGIEHAPPMITRAVLFDVGVLRSGQTVTLDDLKRAADMGGFAVEPGDIALIRTGWGRFFGADNARFSGYYGYATYMLTGETRPFKGGNFDRIKPFHELGNGGLGAFEVALRYDHLNLGDTPVAARAGNQASSMTAGLNWYFNPYAKLMCNWVRFWGDNTPLDPIGSKTKGDAFATRLHLDF